jgi:CheY-like chemotaxis protein
MGRAVGDTPAAAQEPFQAPGPAVAPLCILVAEDNEFNAEYLERQLARQGHTGWHVNNRQEALAVLGIAGQRKAVGARPNPGQGPADAIRAQDAPRLRRVAHTLCGLLSAFSAVAGAVASELEDQAACGRLEESKLLVDQLEALTQELIQPVRSLSIETLRRHLAAAGNPDRTLGP